jgi:FtsZ-binding cell division protein ZapB
MERILKVLNDKLVEQDMSISLKDWEIENLKKQNEELKAEVKRLEEALKERDECLCAMNDASEVCRGKL